MSSGLQALYLRLERMKTLRIGVIGGGQLARMMAPAALNLGIELSILCESEETASARAVAHAPVGDYKDRQTVLDFAESVDVVTFDHEHVPAEILHELVDKGVRVHPGPDALIHAQDKIVMREAVERLGLPNPQWCATDTAADVVAFGEKAGWPIIAKTPRGGYDGKGVEKLDSADDVERISAWFERGQVLCEELVDFSRELSALVARRPSGQTAAWPVAQRSRPRCTSRSARHHERGTRTRPRRSPKPADWQAKLIVSRQVRLARSEAQPCTPLRWPQMRSRSLGRAR